MPTRIKKTSINLLKKFRAEIEKVDNKILESISRRFNITNEIQFLKRGLSLPMNQKKREAALLEKYRKLSKRLKIPTSLTKKVFQLIFSYAKKTGIIQGSKKR